MENRAYYFTASRRKDKNKIFIRCQTNEEHYFNLVDILLDLRFKLKRISMLEWSYFYDNEIKHCTACDLLDDNDLKDFIIQVQYLITKSNLKTNKI